MRFQGYSGKPAGRLAVLEMRQKEMDVAVSMMAGQVSAVLTSTAENTRAMEDLKALFANYLKSTNNTGDGSPSVSISAMETQGDTRPPSVQPGNGGLSKKSPSPVPDISSQSASQGEKTLERPPIVSGKEECRRATSTKGSTGTGRRGTGTASGRTAVKKRTVAAADEGVALPGGESGVGTKVLPDKKAGALQAGGGEDSTTLILQGAEEPALKKGVVLAESERQASRKSPDLKELEGATFKNETAAAAHERGKPKNNTADGDDLHNRVAVKKLEEEDVYSLQALPSNAPAYTSTAVETASSKHTVHASPRKAKKPAAKVDMEKNEDEASTQVRSTELCSVPGSPVIQGTSKLLVFNVHGTLLDCSLLDEKNPNTKIRASAYAVGRRIVCRPWMAEFLNQCFLSFEVAFWGSKSAKYMQDMVTVILGMLKGKEDCVPQFVWSAQECERVELEDGATIEGAKSLEAVYRRWPCWNASNTVIVDHNLGRVACNSMSNVIAANPFYVEHIKKLGDDRGYLKGTLWPMLQALFDAHDVQDFRSRFPHTVPASDNAEREGRQKLNAFEIQGCLQGEGTSGLQFILFIVPSPCHCNRF
jgi:hypothetical protein